jgi:translation elongation factor EF-Tu-like GTPase
MQIFRMSVEDIFQLADGKTAFTGKIDRPELALIGPCDCEIVLNNKVKASIRIDGEMILEKTEKNACRAISTSQPIDPARIGVGRGGFTIRSKA